MTWGPAQQFLGVVDTVVQTWVVGTPDTVAVVPT